MTSSQRIAVLHSAVQRTIADLETLLEAVDAEQAPLKATHRNNIDMQLSSLRFVDAELHERIVSRRTWSLGESSIPVLRAMLNAAGKPRVGLDGAVVDQARASVVALRVELTRFAEGR